MKKYLSYIFSITVLCVVLSSCQKRLEAPETPEFNVTTEKTTYKVGESIVFNFTGAPDNITFFSGQPFREYDMRNKNRMYDLSSGGVTMDFATQLAAGAANSQTGQLSVWISNNYNGNGTFADVKAASWTNLTGFNLATTTTNTLSGSKDISEYFADGKTAYIGFKYLTKTQVDNGPGRAWFIQSFNLKSTLPVVGGQTLLVSNQAMAGFRIIDQYPGNAPSQSSVTTTRITLQPNRYFAPADSGYVAGSPWNDPATETWAISRGLKKDSVNFGPDRGVSLKGLNTDFRENYIFSYNAPGTYKAYFVAANNTIDATAETVRELTLTIEP